MGNLATHETSFWKLWIQKYSIFDVFGEASSSVDYHQKHTAQPESKIGLQKNALTNINEETRRVKH